LLAIFNLFPGYPLDGGRVLRAIYLAKREYSRRHPDRRLLRTVDVAGADRLWNLHGSGAHLSRYFMGLWSVLVGFFAGHGHQRRSQHAHPVTVAQAMSPPVPANPIFPSPASSMRSCRPSSRYLPRGFQSAPAGDTFAGRFEKIPREKCRRPAGA
jgi:hypothetical protein